MCKNAGTGKAATQRPSIGRRDTTFVSELSLNDVVSGIRWPMLLFFLSRTKLPLETSRFSRVILCLLRHPKARAPAPSRTLANEQEKENPSVSGVSSTRAILPHTAIPLLIEGQDKHDGHAIWRVSNDSKRLLFIGMLRKCGRYLGTTVLVCRSAVPSCSIDNYLIRQTNQSLCA